MTRIAVLGAGTIGEALLAGLLRSGQDASELMFTERYPQRCAELTERYGIDAVLPQTAAQRADILVIAVKPQDVEELLAELTELNDGAVVISLCGGLPTSVFERRLPAGTPVVRVMPNTPMVIGEAISAISAGKHAMEQHLAVSERLMRAVGRVVRVPESQQDAVTAISGSGPAYLFLLVEAMIDAGVLLGLPRTVAAELATQSAVGAATMLRDTGRHPALLREGVTSPGGTTSAAVRALEDHGLRTAVFAAVEAARDRSVALGGLQQ